MSTDQAWTTIRPTTVLVVGATGSIGHLVIEEALRQGHATRALARDPVGATSWTPSVRPWHASR